VVSKKDQEVTEARSSSFFQASSRPRAAGLLMSKSMCGCGCSSFISSLMKRLGRTACCSDLFSSRTSEQLQRLAAGCAPQPKVTMPRRPLTAPRPPAVHALSPVCDARNALVLKSIFVECAMRETRHRCSSALVV